MSKRVKRLARWTRLSEFKAKLDNCIYFQVLRTTDNDDEVYLKKNTPYIIYYPTKESTFHEFNTEKVYYVYY